MSQRVPRDLTFALSVESLSAARSGSAKVATATAAQKKPAAAGDETQLRPVVHEDQSCGADLDSTSRRAPAAYSRRASAVAGSDTSASSPTRCARATS